MPSPPEKVWRALTDRDLIARWPMQNDFQPRLGHRFNFCDTPIPNMWNGDRLRDPGVRAHAALGLQLDASGEEAAGGLRTTVTWTLTPVEGGTSVRMEQAGFRPQDEPGRQAMSGGWPPSWSGRKSWRVKGGL